MGRFFSSARTTAAENAAETREEFLSRSSDIDRGGFGEQDKLSQVE